MTPTIKQRLGLEPVQLSPADRERLVAARAADRDSASVAPRSCCSPSSPASTLADAPRIVVPGVFGACLSAAMTLLRYEHTSMAVRQAFAAVSSTLLGVVIVAHAARRPVRSALHRSLLSTSASSTHDAGDLPDGVGPVDRSSSHSFSRIRRRSGAGTLDPLRRRPSGLRRRGDRPSRQARPAGRRRPRRPRTARRLLPERALEALACSTAICAMSA